MRVETDLAGAKRQIKCFTQKPVGWRAGGRDVDLVRGCHKGISEENIKIVLNFQALPNSAKDVFSALFVVFYVSKKNFSIHIHIPYNILRAGPIHQGKTV